MTIESITMITIPPKRFDNRQGQIFQCAIGADFDIAINALALHYFGTNHNGSFLREWHWGGHTYFSLLQSADSIVPLALSILPGHGKHSARKILVQCRYP